MTSSIFDDVKRGREGERVGEKCRVESFSGIVECSNPGLDVALPPSKRVGSDADSSQFSAVLSKKAAIGIYMYTFIYYRCLKVN